MAKRDYAILDAIAAKLHNAEDSLSSVNSELGNFYPDNSREGNVTDLLSAVDALVDDAIALRNSLSAFRD